VRSKPAGPGGAGTEERAAGSHLLSQRIADILRDKIVTEEFEAGARIRERDVAEDLKVSRTPLREALKILAGDGLVVLLPNRGAIVAQPSPAEIAEKLELLGVLEAFAGERAAKDATEEEIGEVRALHLEMLASFARRDRRSYFHLNQRIHLTIVAAAHNAALNTVYRQLNHQVYCYRFRSSADTTHWQHALEEHAAIVQALTERDGPALSILLKDHVGSTWRQIVAAGDSQSNVSNLFAGQRPKGGF
jgi:DNA-binding GntR family transcriptional regulator